MLGKHFYVIYILYVLYVDFLKNSFTHWFWFNCSYAHIHFFSYEDASNFFYAYENVTLDGPTGDEDIRIREAYYFGRSKRKVVYVKVSIDCYI